MLAGKKGELKNVHKRTCVVSKKAINNKKKKERVKLMCACVGERRELHGKRECLWIVRKYISYGLKTRFKKRLLEGVRVSGKRN